MDLSTTIIGVSLFLVAVLPIAALSLSGRRKSKKLKNTFKNLTVEMNLDDQETWNNRLLGIDLRKNQLVYVSSDLPEGITIELKKAKVQLLRLTPDDREVMQVDKTARVVLLFTFREPDLDKIYLTFYDVKTDDPLQLDRFHQIAKKWYENIMNIQKKEKQKNHSNADS